MTRNEKTPVESGALSPISSKDPVRLLKNSTTKGRTNTNTPPKVGIAEIASRCEVVTGNRVTVKNGCFRVACPAHGSKDPNLVVWQNDNETIGMKCYSHGCDRKEIVEALGFTLADILPGRTPTEARRRKVFRNRIQIEQELLHELLLIWKILSKRNADHINKHCQGFKEENPGWEPLPEEPWEREIQAAKRVIAGLGAYYGK